MSFLAHPANVVFAPEPQINGRISLVGASPSVASLVTLRAIRCLQIADIVFYDRLVEPEALAFVGSAAKRVFVG